MLSNSLETSSYFIDGDGYKRNSLKKVPSIFLMGTDKCRFGRRFCESSQKIHISADYDYIGILYFIMQAS